MVFNTLFLILTWAVAIQASTYVVRTDSSKSLDYYLLKYKTQFEVFQASDSVSSFRTFQFGNITGFQGDFPDSLLKSLYSDPTILQISAEQYMKLDAVQEFAPRHLVRLSQKETIKEGQSMDYVFDPTSGIGVDVVVIDSGINQDHEEFSGRVKRAANFVGEEDEFDSVGHGTAIAGVIGSETYGIAKKCNLVDIKVTNKNRVTKLTDVVSALNIACEQAKITQRPTVIVLAMSTKKDKLLNKVIEKIVDQGIPVITSAGNEGNLACKYSPSSAKGTLSVGAINDRDDKIAKFSNWGACVDVFSSGVDVLTTGKRGSEVIMASGTSMSAGVVAGLTAYYMGMGLTGLETVDKIKQKTSSNAVRGLFTKPYSPNKIAFNDEGHPAW